MRNHHIILAVTAALGLFTRLAAEGHDKSQRNEITIATKEADGDTAVAEAYGKLRSVVWKHWQLRIPGKITLTGTTTEGNSYSRVYVFEKDDRGIWRIRVQSREEYFDSATQTNHEWLKDQEVYGVERFTVSKGGRQAPRRLKESSIARSKSYRLMLKDRLGNVVVQSL